MEYEIIHLPEQNKFTTEVDGITAYVEYYVANQCLDIIHTIVPRPIEGRGIAAALVRATYDYAIQSGLKPRCSCSYAEMWLRRHPEYKKD